MINKKSPFTNCNIVFNLIFVILGAFSWFAPDIFIDLRYKYTWYFIIAVFALMYIIIFLLFTILAYIAQKRKQTAKIITYLVVTICCIFCFFIFFNTYSSVSFASYNNITKATFSNDEDTGYPKIFEQKRDEIKEVFRGKYQIKNLIRAGDYKIKIEFDDREPLEIRRKIAGFKYNINVKHLGR